MKSYNDAKPIGIYTKKELINLEHEWRLKLKADGFSDIESWDNNTKAKIKRVKFIKSHVRYRGSDAKTYWRKGLETLEFFRIIGIYAHNCKDCKYVEVLKHYSISGNVCESIRETKSKYMQCNISIYIKKNLNNMIKYVRGMDNE